jgi:hypothetical protein
MRARRVVGILLAGAACCVPARGVDPPAPAPSDLRAGFLAQFPRSDANGTALELEERAAAIGIDLAPKPFWDPSTADEPPPSPHDGRARPAPGTDLQLPLSEFLQEELTVTTEKIGRASPLVERFLEEHEGEISQIQVFLLANEEPRWEVDVEAGVRAPLPNLVGMLRLQRLLLTRALIRAREGKADDAVAVLESSWRLQSAVLSRPELISQLIAIAVAKLQAGVLRKIDSPAYGWAERLRSPSFGVNGYEAALQNETWMTSSEVATQEELGETGRFYRRFIERVERFSSCSWSADIVEGAWRDAAAEMNNEDGSKIHPETWAVPNLKNGLMRARRVAIDSELTALVLDARAERAAERRPQWPARLLTLNAGICPEARWSYRVDANGTARFRFENRLEGADSAPFQLPLEFTAGKPRPPKPRVVVHPPLALGR